MSLAALARLQPSRRASAGAAGGGPGKGGGGLHHTPLPPFPAPAAPAPRADGFDNLVRYIPTETVTIFVAVCSARSAVETIAGGFSYGTVYLACAALTPGLLCLIGAGRYRAAGGTGRVPMHWWPLFAATAAFLVWALSVPGVTSMLTDDPARQAAWGVLAGVAAVLVSLALSLLERVFGP